MAYDRHTGAADKQSCQWQPVILSRLQLMGQLLSSSTSNTKDWLQRCHVTARLITLWWVTTLTASLNTRKHIHTLTRNVSINMECFSSLYVCVFSSNHSELQQNYAFSNLTSWWAVKMTSWLIDREGTPAFFSQFWVHRIPIGCVQWFWCSGGLVIQESKIINQNAGAFTKIW